MPYYYATNDDGNEVLMFRDEEGNVRRTNEGDSQAVSQWQETMGIYSPDQIYEKAITGPDGQQYIPAFNSTQGGIRFSSDLEAVRESLRAYEGSVPGVSNLIMGPDGNVYMPRAAADTIGQMSSQGGGFIHQFLNGPGAVLLPLAVVGGAAFAAAGTGAAGGAGALEGATIGNASGIGGSFANIGATGTAGLSAADILGLQQMGQAAGLSGSALEAFVASGGTLGSTAAGGLGGFGSLAEMYGYATPEYTAATYGGSEVAPGGAMDMGGSSGSGIPGSGPASQTSYASIYGPAAAGATTLGGASSIASLLKSMGVDAGTADTIGSFLPNATLGSLLTGLAQGGLGYLGADKIADATVEAQRLQNEQYQKAVDAAKEMQERYLGLGQPYRDLLGKSYQPGFSIWDDLATKDAAGAAADISARSYSATAGNPFDQPTSQGGIYRDVLSQVALPQLNKYRDQLGTFGQFGVGNAATAGGSAINNIANQGNNAFQGVANAGSGLDAVGAGISSALNPPLSQTDLLKFLSNYKMTTGS